MRRAIVPAMMLLLMVGQGACRDGIVPIGSKGGACKADGTCDEGLICVSDRCVEPETCTPEAERPCQCAGELEGTATCDASGAWGPCECGRCGDGVVDAGEECDAGEENSDTEPDACRTDCQEPRCGDGVVDADDACDDGNNVDGDGCAANCVVEVCGDGVIQGGEVCDGAASAGLTCADFGFESGTLACATDCGPVLAGCHTCGNGVCEASENPSNCSSDCPPTQKVDVLFVIDNSVSMAEEQAQVRAQIGSFVTGLRDPVLGLPDLHIGVTSTDLGTGSFGSATFCSSNGGDAGHLLTGTCTNPVGAPYIVDLAPAGCTVQQDGGGQCTGHDCTAANCAEGSLQVDAATGCPRCRNYDGQDMEAVFSCIADLGVDGCGFEQPMEAMRLALDPSTTANAGFLRSDAILGVFFLTDEDDCSASSEQLFDPSDTEIDSPLGPLTSYRCFEFGVTCDVNSRTQTGERHNCMPRTDAGALLHYVGDYVTFLGGLRDPGHIVVAAAAGPVLNHTAIIDQNEYMWPELQPSCTSGANRGVPGIRLLALVEQFVDPMDLPWAFAPICSLDYANTLTSFAQEIRSRM